MDDRKLPISLTALCRHTDAGEARLYSVHEESSSVVYFSRAEEISEGFTTALRAMGFDEILLSDFIPKSDTTSNPEER